MLRPLLYACFAFVLIGCSQEADTLTDVPDVGGTSPRHLKLSTETELDFNIKVAGQCLTDINGYALFIVPKSGYGPYFMGNEFTKDISTSTNLIPATGNQIRDNCPHARFEDGFAQTTENSFIWNGVFTATVITPADTCYVDFAMNYVNQDSNNGNFFDQMAGDQVIDINLSSGEVCLGANITGEHPFPSSDLEVEISDSSTDWGLPGDTFSFIPDPSGGFGSYQYAWQFLTPSAQITEWTDFSTSNPYKRVFEEEGTYAARVLVRDGNDTMDPVGGGQYAISGSGGLTGSFDFGFAVEEPVAHNAMDMGNSLPTTVWGTVWYASSVTMKNTGTETWSGSSFTLDQMPSQIWNPSNTGLGAASIETAEMHTFNFNMVTYESNQGYYDNYWKMKNGTMFGQDNGHSTYNKGIHPDSSLASTGQWISRLLALMSPRELIAAGHWDQSDVVQVLRKEGFPLDAARVQEDGRYVLRYMASLDEDWDVDFSLRVQFDPRQFSVGSLIKGTRSETHDIHVRMTGPGELLVEGTRFSSNKGLVGRGTIFALPLELKNNAQAPSSLPLVELIAYE